MLESEQLGSTKVLITGITSSIGVYTIGWIKENIPNVEIFGCGRNRETLEKISKTYNIDARFVDFDNENDLAKNSEEFAKIDLDYIFHLATISPSGTKQKSQFYKTNFIGPRIFFEGIFQLHKPSFLNFSSASLYDFNALHLSENAPRNYGSDYGMSKYLFENYLNQYKKLASLLSVRIPVLLAPSVKHNFISEWESQVQLCGKVTLFNPDHAFNSCAWLGDIYHFALYYFSKQKNDHLVCNVGASSPISIGESLEIYLKERECCAEIISYASPRPSQHYDSSLAMRNGYIPKTVRECITRYARSLKISS